MDGRGRDASGESPEDPEDAQEPFFGEDAEPTSEGLADDLPPRGWIPPEDRLWRHPSEIGRHVAAAAVRTARASERRATITASVVGAAAVATAVVAALVLTDGTPASRLSTAITDTSQVSRAAGPDTTAAHGGAPASTPGAQSGTQMIPATADVGHLVDGLRPSLVGISTGDPGRPLATGVAMAHGVIVTTVAAVSGAAHLDVVTASGQREPAQILGTDSGSGVAVLQIADELPPAAFADDDADTDELAVAACLCGSLPPAGTVPVSQALTAVRATGVEPVLAGVQLLDAVEAGVPAALGPSPVGAPLVDGRGRVLGILAGSLGGGSTGVFVSAPLVAGVADQLAATRQVSHGWLGVAGTDTPDACGVTVTAVQPGSPAAAAGLHAGEVVSGVDGHRVCSLGELRARLYVLAPGTPTEIDIAVPSGTAPVTAVLTGAPG